MAEFLLHVPDIDETGRDYAFELSPGWLDANLRDATLRHDPAFGPGAVEVRAQDNGGGEYLVTGHVSAHLLTECGRCLGDAKVSVDTTLASLFARAAVRSGAAHHEPQRHRHRQAGHAHQYERHVGDDPEDDEMLREEFSGNDIPLDGLIREHIVLEVPMQPLCSEQCQGIAVPEHLRPPADAFPGERSGPGAVDPRLAPLQRLRDNVPPGSGGGRPQGSSPSAPAQKQASNRQANPKLKPKSNKE